MLPRSMGAALRAALILVAAALLATGCRGQIGETPAPTPLDFEGIVGELSRAGIEVREFVSGDPGCVDQTLAGAAIRTTVKGLDQATPVRVHFFLFRDGAAYQRRRADVDACLRASVADPATVVAVDASPFVAAGIGPWAPSFRETLRTVLIAATRGGERSAGASPS